MNTGEGGGGPYSAVALFHSPSDPTRLAIATQLALAAARRGGGFDGRAGVGAVDGVSAHGVPARGLVTGRPQGRQVFYSLARPELMDLLSPRRVARGDRERWSRCARTTAPAAAAATCPRRQNRGVGTSETPAEVRE